jgi:uncharacterized protein involved in exopolysaccharide biosynthesis
MVKELGRSEKKDEIDMTIQNAESTAPDQWAADDEIDLRQYIDVLVNWWREIALITLLSALFAGAAVFLIGRVQDPRYDATATAVIARVSSDVNFDDRFLTSSADDGVSSAADSRRSALLGLVKNGAIAQTVIDELGAQWPEEERVPATLLESVQAELAPGPDTRNPSDLIRITVTANEPGKAADIANAWTEHYVEVVNAIYGQVPEDVIASVQREQAGVERRYLDAQESLEGFIGASRMASLNRQLETERALLESLKLSQISTASAVLERDLNARLDLFNRLVDAEVRPSLALVEQQTNQNVQVVADLLAVRSQIQQALGQARTLRAQVNSGGDAAAATNGLALQLLKAQVFASTSPASAMALPNSLQLNIDATSPATVAEQQMDIDALITALEGYLSQLNDQIDQIGQDILANDSYKFVDELTSRGFTLSSAQPPALSVIIGGTDGTPSVEIEREEIAQSEGSLSQAIAVSYENLFGLGLLTHQARTAGLASGGSTVISDEMADTMRQLEANIQQLSAQVEQEAATQRQLTQQRDLAWTAYETLNNKVVELNLARSAANSEVRLGAPAIPPVKPILGISPIVAVALGGAVGFMFAIFLAFFSAYVGKRPPLRRGKAGT